MTCGKKYLDCIDVMSNASGVTHATKNIRGDEVTSSDFATTVDQQMQVLDWSQSNAIYSLFYKWDRPWHWAENGELARYEQPFEVRLPIAQAEQAAILAARERSYIQRVDELHEIALKEADTGNISPGEWDEINKFIEKEKEGWRKKDKERDAKRKNEKPYIFIDSTCPLLHVPDNVTDDWLLGCAKSLLMIRGDTAWTAKEAKKLNGIEVRITELCKNRGLDVPVMKTDEQIAIENRQIAVNAIADSAKALPDNEANNQRLLGIKDVKSMLEEVLAVHPNANGKTSITLDELTRILMHKN